MKTLDQSVEKMSEQQKLQDIQNSITGHSEVCFCSLVLFYLMLAQSIVSESRRIIYEGDLKSVVDKSGQLAKEGPVQDMKKVATYVYLFNDIFLEVPHQTRTKNTCSYDSSRL